MAVAHKRAGSESVLQGRFIANVNARLEALDISRSELARRMGVSQPVVVGYLSGRSSPGFGVVEKFAAGLELEDPNELLKDPAA